MTPGQLESAASSLRPCSILDDTREVESESENEESEQENGELERDNEESESENEERENEESERENEVSRDSDLDCDRKQEVEAAGQEVGGVNEEEVGGGVERGVSPDHTGTASDVELVIDYGDDGEERQEGLRSALLRQLVVKKRERGRERRRRHRHHHETSGIYVATTLAFRSPKMLIIAFEYTKLPLLCMAIKIGHINYIMKLMLSFPLSI